MSPSSPESLASSFVSLSLSQARSPPSSTRSVGGVVESSGDEFIVLPRPATAVPTTAGPPSTPNAKAGRSRTFDSASSAFSLVNAPSQDEVEADANGVDRWLASSPQRRQGQTPTLTAFRGVPSGFSSHDQDPSSSSEHGGSSVGSGGRKRLSGRARQRLRARELAAEARRDAAALGRGPSTPTSTRFAHDRPVGSHTSGEESSGREDEDEVDSVLGSDFTDELASDTIDDFLENAHVFALRGDSGKLQLYQAFCVELGLCLPPTSSSYASSSFRSRSNSSASDASADSDRTSSRRSVTPTRSTTPTQADYLPFPTSITQATRILKQNAFVNLRDYFELRTRIGDGTSYTPASAGSVVSEAQGSAGARTRVSTAEGRAVRNAALKELRFPSKQALRRYTLENRRIVNKKIAKEALLQPLLIDMFFPGQY